jgi:RNA recognition motif-containing protein
VEEGTLLLTSDQGDNDPNGRGHRGFGFIEFAEQSDALDAIDNMHLNELNGRVLKVNLSRPLKGQQQMGTNRAGEISPWSPLIFCLSALYSSSVCVK